MSSALNTICDNKRSEVASRKQRMGLAEVESRARDALPTRGFHTALRARSERGEYGVIAEFKKGSPSKGLIRDDVAPSDVARAYEYGGAACVSILTDEHYFLGSDADLMAAREAILLPVLRKDFMIDVWQVPESRMLGADCVLVIMAALDDILALEIEAAAFEWGMDVLVEVHDRNELDRSLNLRSPLLGINNRNLKSLQTSLSTTIELAPLAAGSGRHVIAESGLRTPRDLAEAWDAGARSFLVGESLMRKDDPAAALRGMLTADGGEEGESEK